MAKLRGSHERCVYGAERKRSVAEHELSDPDPVAGIDGFSQEIPLSEVLEEPNLCPRAEPRTDQPGNFGYDQAGDEQRTSVCREECDARLWWASSLSIAA